MRSFKPKSEVVFLVIALSIASTVGAPSLMWSAASDVAYKNRQQAWDRAMADMVDDEAREVVAFVQSRVQECQEDTPNSAAGVSVGNAIFFTLDFDAHVSNAIARRKTHEAYCLEQVRGEVRVASDEGRQMALGVKLPM